MTRRRVTVVASVESRRALAPLIDAYGARHHVTICSSGGRAVPAPDDLTDIADHADAIVVAGWRSRSPRTVLPGPGVTTSDGRLVPAGWLPDVGTESLTRFAHAAATIHARRATSQRCTTAVLGSRVARYEDLARRIERLIGHDDPDASHRWTAGDQLMEDALAGLDAGPAAVVYVGHGRPVGWAGYRGVRAEHLHDVRRPSAFVMSFTCLTASRRRVGLSFAEQIVLQGSTSACLGAVTPTDHQWNGRWAYRMCRSLADARTVGDLVVAARPESQTSPYRLIGDPLAPLLDAPGAREEMIRHTTRHRDLAASAGRNTAARPDHRPQEQIA